MIVQALLDIQQRYGYLPQEELEFLSLRGNVPLYRIQELTTFFPHFRRQEPPEVTVHVCQTMSCHIRGAPRMIEQLEEMARQQPLKLEVCGVSCLGRCDRAPVAFVSRHAHEGPSFHDHLYTDLGPRRELKQIVSSIMAGKVPAPDHDNREHGKHPLWKIDIYDPRHGQTPEPYAAVKKFLKGWPITENVRKGFHEGKIKPTPLPTLPAFLSSESVIDLIEDADLVGLGGAAARTGKKWRDVRDARGEKRYIICNGDESEPGTFKDRELLLHAPHLVVEGMLMAALVLGASEQRPTRGYIYIRHEYHEQIGACRVAIELAKRIVPRALELCPMEVFTSPGLYICGEESALIEAIEGKRAQPRNQPPDIRNNGLFDQPTLVNNVETYAWVPSILVREPHGWYRDEPRRFFSISGDLKDSGVREVPFTSTLGQLIESCGGMRDGLQFYAIAPSGPSGGFLPASLDGEWVRKTLDDGIPGLSRRSKLQGARVAEYRKKMTGKRISVLDLPLDVPLFRTLELSLGAGIVVYGARPGEKLNMIDQALNLLQFFKKESCGKCVPCRLGCQQLVHFAEEIQGGRSALPMAQTAEVVRQLSGVMEITSICGLGRAAPNAFTTWLEYFSPLASGNGK